MTWPPAARLGTALSTIKTRDQASMAVSPMLSYTASQSNAGGSAWYGQVKATHGLAKDAFDAINNQVAFSP